MIRAVLTAVLTPGVHTQRVARILRPTREARALLSAADRAAHPEPIELPCDPEPRQTPKRPRQPAARGYVVIAISTYPGDLDALDAAVAELRSAGVRRANRSWLIRMAVRALDVPALIATELARR